MRKHSRSSSSHTLIAWKFNNAIDRISGTLPSTAVVTFVASDLGRRAYDIDTQTFWDISEVVAGVPTWISGGGPAGVFGGDSQPYTYSTTTTDSDPGSGVIRFDNTTLSSATKAYIDLLNSDSVDVTAWIDVLDGSSSTIKGTLRVVKKTDQSIFHTFQINAANTTAAGYRKLNLTYVTGNGSFVDTEEIVVSFTRQGDVGDTGATGSTGPTGSTGATGSAAAITPGSTDNALVRADGTGNNAIQGSPVIVEDSGSISLYRTKRITLSGTSEAINETTVPSGSVVFFTSATAVTATIANSVAADWCFCWYQKGAGQVTFAVTGGALRNGHGHTKSYGQYAAGTITCESNAGSAPEVYLAGDTA